MGLLDSIAGQVLGSVPSGQHGGLMDAVTAMIQRQPGGLHGLVDAFESRGLGGVMSSWIGTGQNQPISPDQVNGVLGSEQVQAIAARLGLPPDLLSSHLANLLPHVVDHMTPTGTLPPAQ